MAYRVLLPDDVLPVEYHLELEPDLKAFRFAGRVRILCDVRVATDVVTLHSKELAFEEAAFEPAGGGKTLDAIEIRLVKKDTTVAFTFEEPLPTGQGTLTVKFFGILNNQMAGFYRSQYTRADGTSAFMGVTQFEATDARRCFPCWDEPARKAVFHVTLTIPADLMALSNMPESEEELLADGRRRVTFMPTPKMSTYLLAVCVGEFESLAKLTKDGVLLRVLCVPGKRTKCQYSLECGVRALEFYNEFFGVPFPLPKMDMIAIPDFAAGAMENWGLVTYREVDMLCDVATVSIARKQRICTVVTHELAHQWFGNLVTMAWWDDLWLNEGFANWMQCFSVDALAPEWDIWTGYVGDNQQRALQLDALRSSHPIQVPIAHAREVEEVFDAISYSKGGSLVRMLFSVLGHDHFRAGLQLYFRRHAYGNTETADLAAAWAEVSGLPVPELVQSWTVKMGFPVLRVLNDPFASGKLEVEQAWFLGDGSVQPGDDKVTWMVPLHVGTDGSAKAHPMTFLREKRATVDCPTAGASWLKVNYGQHVPCRVLYPPALVHRLSHHLTSLPAADRIGLLSDAYALCKAGLADPSQLGELLAGFRSEANDKVWAELATTLGALNRLFQLGLDPEVAAAFRAFAAKLVTPKAKEVGWDAVPGESDNTKTLRSTLAGLLALFCATEAWVWEAVAPKFEALCGAGAESVSQDVRSAVLSIAMKHDPTPATYERLRTLHAGSSDDALKRDIYAAVAKGPVAVQRQALAWCLTEEVKSQDMVWLPMGVAVSGAEGAELAFSWVQTDYNPIHARLGASSMMLFSSIVRISGGGFVTREKAAEVYDFWQAKPIFEQVKKTVGQTREAIEANAQFVDRLRASTVNAAAYWAAL